MTTETYNGWTNYETWNVKLWMDNDEKSYRHWNERAKAWMDDEYFENPSVVLTQEEHARYSLAVELKNHCAEENPLRDEASMWSDLLGAALSEVDWNSIAKHLIDEIFED